MRQGWAELLLQYGFREYTNNLNFFTPNPLRRKMLIVDIYCHTVKVTKQRLG
jgi:hypothetical protein